MIFSSLPDSVVWKWPPDCTVRGSHLHPSACQFHLSALRTLWIKINLVFSRNSEIIQKFKKLCSPTWIFFENFANEMLELGSGPLETMIIVTKLTDKVDYHELFFYQSSNLNYPLVIWKCWLNSWFGVVITAYNGCKGITQEKAFLNFSIFNFLQSIKGKSRSE